MRETYKWILALAVPTLIVGGVVSFGGGQFAPQWTLAFPLGVILLGLSVITWMMKGEAAKFDVEQRARMESAGLSRPEEAGKRDQREDEPAHASGHAAAHSS